MPEEGIGLNDFNITTKQYCATCLSGGVFVEMENLDSVEAGQFRKCPTCAGTVGVTCGTWERKVEE